MLTGEHRGIRFSIRESEHGVWSWQIQPPDCVIGLRPDDGTVAGDRNDAISAAKKAIEDQTPVH